MPIPANTSMLVSPRRQAQVFSFPGFPYGINKSAGAKQLEVGELVEGLNFKYTDDGRLVTRPGLRKVTIGGTESGSAIKCISNGLINVSGVKFDEHYFDEVDLYFGGSASATKFQHYVMVSDANNKIYYLASHNLVYAGTAGGQATLAPFGGYVMVFDGTYLKYWNGNNLKICYDDGDDGYQVDYTAEATDSTVDIFNDAGGYTKAGSVFTTQDWTAGYTIPLTTVEVMMSKTGSPTGSMYCKLYATAAGAPTGSPLTTSSAMDVASSFTGAMAEKITFPFDIDNTYGMSPNTAYFISIEYAGGDASNHIHLHGNTVASTGREYYYDSTWKNTATRNPRIAVKPSRPPKASFGCSWQNRLWFVDPDNPGWVRFTNANTIFDFSTTNGGGYIGTVDDSSASFPVGALYPFYGNMFVFGRRESPYLVKFTGTSPDDFAQQTMLQEIKGSYLAVTSTINDIWFANESNVYNITGVQEYGDIRSNEPGNPISSIVMQYFDEDAFSGFNPIDGQYWLKLAGYSRVLVGHTRRGVKVGDVVRYPWTEYLFNGITPTAFGFSVNTFYVGATDGHLYSLNTEYADDGVQPIYDIKSCVLEHPFSDVTVNEYYLQANSDASATFSLKFYKNGSASSFLTKPITALTDRIRGKLRFPCRSVQFEMSDFTITKPVNIGGLHLKGVQTEAI